MAGTRSSGARWIVAGAAVALASVTLASAPFKPTPYLTGQAVPRAVDILPPAPVEGADRYEADRRVFRATRTLKDSPRWSLAIEDGLVSPPQITGSFACALGVNLDAGNAPRLVTLLRRTAQDANQIASAAKVVYNRRRPFFLDEGETCVPRAMLGDNPDYPSGHATWGWSTGLILAELAPDRATAVLTRARAFGESRVVCGVHSASAVEAGRMTGSALVAALHADPRFREDLEATRAEIAAVRGSQAAGPDAAACAAEAAVIAKTPY